MNKLSLSIAASAMAMGAFASPCYVGFSSTGPDKYADGTDVKAGEIYALVWTPDGSTFSGFSADGTVAEPSKLVAAAPLAVVDENGGHCRNVYFMLTGANEPLASSGSFEVYLIDTRTFTTGADGVITGSTVGGVNSDKTFTTFNTYTKVDATVSAGSSTSAPAVSAAAADLSNVPQPTVSGITVSGGNVVVTVENTVPYLKYDVVGASSIADLAAKGEEKGAEVTAKSDSMTLMFDDAQAGDFFKVKVIQK